MVAWLCLTTTYFVKSVPVFMKKIKTKIFWTKSKSVEIETKMKKEFFSFDLAMTPSMKYYTGIIIKGYSPYSADTIINGGRYDKLMDHFHKVVPAIGFSYDLSHILKALEKEEENNA